MGLTLPYSASTPAVYPEKKQECIRAGLYLRKLLEKDIKPLDIMTRPAFLNAIILTMVLAVARACEVDLTLDDFQRIAETTPVLADLQPSGKVSLDRMSERSGTDNNSNV
jgi:dihydroxy-acid dehydratase